ncbi:hypothetical protein [Blastochloris tepida]|jgi:hypothetical protein|uniref:Uncharacterized protein n=1 Tax=Blastochloris tepida TaxID=2233851 RepID=A0A348G1W5_9HYPH|nr:hypothetical protein [Blastochloris tepida]BBF93548.1 hypothetical protein BLTE_22330 [Blastochloris tepida]
MVSSAPPAPEELERLRVLYEDRRGPALPALAAGAGLSLWRLNQLAIAQGWQRRRGPVGLGRSGEAGPGRHRGFACTGLATCREREAMVTKLLATCEEQVAAAADRLATRSADLVPEREARTLAVLARTIERLTALDRKAVRTPAQTPAEDSDDRTLPRDYSGLRTELARRLAELEGERPGGGVPGPPDG